jgi:hypothetical protein
MVWRGLVRFIGAPLVALFAALLLTTGPVMAADPACSVTVDPPSAVGGSVFTFTGTGFKATQLLLQKGNGGPIVNDIDPGTADPWTQNVESRAGDEGDWTATFVEQGGCAIAVHFQVTLSSTDVISDLLSNQPNTSLPTLFYLMVVGFGLCGGAFLSRRLGAARSGLSH